MAIALEATGPSRASADSDRILAPVVAYSTRDDRRVHLLRADDLSLTTSIDAGVGAAELAIGPEGRWLLGRSCLSSRGGGSAAERRLVVLDLSVGAVHSATNLHHAPITGALSRLPGLLESAASLASTPVAFQTDPESGQSPLPQTAPKPGQRCILSPDGTTAYISQPIPGSVAVVDLSSGTAVAEISVPMGAEGLAISPDGTRVWVASGRSGSISIIDTRTLHVERTLPCRGFPFRVAFSPDGTLVAVSCPTAGEVVLFNAANPEDSRRIGVRSGRVGLRETPTSLAFVPGGERLAVLCDAEAPQLVLIDLRSASVVRRVDALGPVADGLVSAFALVPLIAARETDDQEPQATGFPPEPRHPA